MINFLLLLTFVTLYLVNYNGVLAVPAFILYAPLVMIGIQLVLILVGFVLIALYGD